MVPLFMIASPDRMPAIDTGFKASHSNLFATLLDLMNYPQNKRKYDYSISLLKARESDSRKRFYYAGDLNDPVKGNSYPYDE